MTQVVEDAAIRVAFRAIGLVLAGGGVTALGAAGYRWYARERAPTGIAVLVSLGVVALYLNTTSALRSVMGGQLGVLDLTAVLVNGATFAAAGLVAPLAVRAGDRLAGNVAAVSGAAGGEVGELVRAAGRVIAVELPGTVDDLDGYDPVAPETRAALAGTTLRFPRGLTVGELERRLVDRLREDFGVGHVDIELAADGTVEHLAVGRRAAGLGPTLPPRTVAVAVRADPAYSASPGDRVQLWRPGEPPERVAAGELRGTAGDVATVALDEADAAAIDDATRYRLVTLPAAASAANEFAGVLRAADETLEVVTVGADSDLVGTALGALATPVVAVRTGEGDLAVLPGRERRLTAGDRLYVIGRPEAVRRLADAAGGRAGERPDRVGYIGD